MRHSGLIEVCLQTEVQAVLQVVAPDIPAVERFLQFADDFDCPLETPDEVDRAMADAMAAEGGDANPDGTS